MTETESDKLERAAELTHIQSGPIITERCALRSVASSTAIETGQSVLDIERKLKEADGKYQDLKLGR